ncbi:hypothetical protein H4R18_005033 [Coemansia javaensis]|uniref:TRIP4/RQT4 C2HC5-type zinc finger domain-containing protein n=1 Tax=Coemansia javaensis TaxID=2761396 RepID=A0A9W8H9X3_9FUNG|nr:hypothetical protein H4R18_005033 [Coemansia javaensis]
MDGAHALSAAEQTWAAQQVAAIVGAPPEDAAPLAAFLAGIADANELQAQLLDMLGESPLALDFAAALIAKRFPAGGAESPAPPLPPRTAPAAQKSQRQLKRERQQELREQRQRQQRAAAAAQRTRTRCECQAAAHALLTNCLACGRIVCDAEGPGPCMFCGNDVESAEQQLQQHMRRQLQRAGAQPMGGAGAATGSSGLLWNDGESSAAAGAAPPPPDDEDRHMERAFRALGVARADADAAAARAAEAWVEAARRKERLLGFDRTAAQRTRLIDESADFDPDAVDKWMSAEERAAAEARQRERARVEQAREDRARRGVRVLHLDLGAGTASLSREPGAPPPPPPPPRDPQPLQPAQPAQPLPQLLRQPPPRFVADEVLGKKARGAGASGDPAGPAADPAAKQRQMLRVQSDEPVLQQA